MDDWRGRWCAIIFFTFAALVVLNPQGFPARDWFNEFVDATFGRFRFM
jgi:hypothetical protein